MALWPTQPVTEMSTRSISWAQKRPVLKVDNLTTILGHCHAIREPNFLEPCRHLGPVMGLNKSNCVRRNILEHKDLHNYLCMQLNTRSCFVGAVHTESAQQTKLSVSPPHVRALILKLCIGCLSFALTYVFPCTHIRTNLSPSHCVPEVRHKLP